jgi:hypothetical protein
MEPAISLETAKVIVADKSAPRVTEESIKAKIDFVTYEVITLGATKLTLCFINMRNGFIFVGKAAPASPANFDAQVGERYAYEDAFKQIWSHEGYLLKEKLKGV